MHKPSKSGSRHKSEEPPTPSTGSTREERIPVRGTMREAKKAALQKLIELNSQRLEDVEIIGLITTDFGPVSSGDGLLAVGVEGGFPVANSPPLYEFRPNPGNADRVEDFGSIHNISGDR